MPILNRLLPYFLLVSTLMFAGCFIQGRVVDENGVGVAGVTVSLSDGTLTAVTNCSGYYVLGNLFDPGRMLAGNYMVTPSKDGYSFMPGSMEVTISSVALEDTGWTVPWPAFADDFVAEWVQCITYEDAYFIKSSKQRITSPDVAQGDIDKLVDGNSEFAFDLYQMIRDEKDNMFYSPYSICLALTMAYAGAEGNTEQQMADTLNYNLSEDRLHQAFNALELALAGREDIPGDPENPGFKLNIANAIWGQQDYCFLTEFLDVLSENYGAGMRVLDFSTQTEPSRITINDWVSDQTEGKIQNLIPKGTITPLTRLVLTNAIYFNAAWALPFEKENTSTGDFTLTDGSIVAADMMNQVTMMSYAEGQDYRAVEMLYSGHEFSMLIIVPETGYFESFESQLGSAKLGAIISQLSAVRVDISMPKFTFEMNLGLSKVLKEMGMTDAFYPKLADFSNMDGTSDLFISDVLHKAFIKVDEEGTEAAAATAIIISTTSVITDPEYVRLKIDRPFIFLIRDIETETILFVGRVVDPNPGR